MCLQNVKSISPEYDTIGHKVFRVGHDEYNKYCLLPLYNAYVVFDDISKTYTKNGDKIIGSGCNKYREGFHAYVDPKSAIYEMNPGLVYAKVHSIQAHTSGLCIGDHAVVSDNLKFVNKKIMYTDYDFRIYVFEFRSHDWVYTPCHEFNANKFERDMGVVIKPIK